MITIGTYWGIFPQPVFSYMGTMQNSAHRQQKRYLTIFIYYYAISIYSVSTLE